MPLPGLDQPHRFQLEFERVLRSLCLACHRSSPCLSLPDYLLSKGFVFRGQAHPNKCYKSFRDFSNAMLDFLRDEVPTNWHTLCDEVSDNFRVINPKDYRILR
jgi:hypothetical protein